MEAARGTALCPSPSGCLVRPGRQPWHPASPQRRLPIAWHGFHRRGESLRAGISASIATPRSPASRAAVLLKGFRQPTGQGWTWAASPNPGLHLQGEPGEVAP